MERRRAEVPPDSFGERLRRHREAAGYSQESLAARAGLSANAVGALERGERRHPYPDTVRRLADALGLSDVARRDLARTLHGDPTPPPAAGPPPQPGKGFEGLPGEPTPLFGRQHEIAGLMGLLREGDRRLVTLTGAGGVGKSRLALQVAHRLSDAYGDGTVWVDLAPLADPSLVVATISYAMGLDEGRGDPAEALRSWLRDRDVLLVLDNLEHLPGAVPDLAHLLDACPGLCALVTSRSPLGVRGEQVFPVPPLDVPPAGSAPEEEVASSAAVRLFVWAARQRNPSFELTRDNAKDVAALCRRVDGLPLALELVAARSRVLGVRDLLARVEQLMPLLVGGARDLPERQRTMRAAIAWSEDLLRPPEQVLFRRLSAFAGGWTLEAAEAVGLEEADGVPAVLDRLEALVDQSLVTVTHGRDGTRYGMLEPIRQFARERLVSAGDEEATCRRHASFFRSWAERAAGGIEGRAEQALWVARVEREQDNLRAALAWAAAAEDGAETGLRTATALWRFWEMRWQVDEGFRWLTAALDRCEGRTRIRADGLNAAGNLARDLGDHQRARMLHQECLAIRRELGAVRGIAASWNNLGVVARDLGDAEETLRLCQEALDLFRQAGDTHGAAIALISMGAAAGQQRDDERARAFYGESLALFRGEGDDWHTGWVLSYLAELLVRSGDVASGASMAAEGLAIHRECGEAWGVATALGVLGASEQAVGDLDEAARLYAEALLVAAAARVERAIPSCLDNLAGVLLAGGHPDRAALLAGAGAAWREVRGSTRHPGRDEASVAALENLRGGAYAGRWREGRSLSRAEVLREAAGVPALLGHRSVR